ncbi:MAG: chloride channel protein [Ectothiorhodospiraceae bacterium]|nr:chloride channel protein [Chromatiales bacterium]MCP5153489.1 chloride channel protein [Ectothiorhodospiraceae bacterium]
MNAFDTFRERLARADALLPLTVLGAVSGLITGGVIIAFRWITEGILPGLGLVTHAEAFETLDWPLRLLLPVLGALAVGALFQAASVRGRQVGVVHVMERLAYHAGRMPLRNAVLQFVGGAVSIVCGHSVGREGPVIHVGAASASLMGQWLRFPNNSIRTLVACGIAAGIAASFNTPVAGVIFAMEVVMLEYSAVGFTPVILAAVCATSLSRAVYGAEPAFAVPALQLVSLWELPFLILVGTVIGCLASALVALVPAVDARLRHLALWLRASAAGAAVGLLALAVPEVMGVGYDTVNATLLGLLGLQTLLAIAAAKLLASALCIGLGLPGGVIGPTLVVGATAGGALGVIGHGLVPGLSADSGLYAMLGMGAMMGATLQAPLAALMAILELTANPNIILPGMLVIVSASMTARLVFGRDSLFVAMLRGRGLDYRYDPVAVSLERTGVSAVMSRRLTPTPATVPIDRCAALLARSPDWLLVVDDRAVVGVVPAERAARLVAEHDADGGEVDLAAASVADGRLAVIAPLATLREALDRLDAEGADFALVSRSGRIAPEAVTGVVTREQIESSVRYRGG